MMFNNCGNIGLPLAVLAWGERALPAAVMMFMVSNLAHFSVGARLLDPAARIVGLWRIPSVSAMIAGFTVSSLGIAVWPPLHAALKMLGDISIPLLLFALGVRMTGISLRDLGVPLAGALLPAVMNFLFAERYHQEPERVASIVLVGNLAAVLTLPLVLAAVL
jgi:predicted permease